MSRARTPSFGEHLFRESVAAFVDRKRVLAAEQRSRAAIARF
jgi:hypothetical protein